MTLINRKLNFIIIVLEQNINIAGNSQNLSLEIRNFGVGFGPHNCLNLIILLLFYYADVIILFLE